MEETLKKRKSTEEIRCVECSSEEYPERLRRLPNMPRVIYVKGNLPDDKRPSIAIVGARMCSAYGRIQAFHYAEVLSRAGVQVISGLASGIDAEGHQGALQGGTPTFAVLGCGVDKCYPVKNRNLYQRIVREQGGIISEYLPGTPAMSHHFPARNRIISALADIVLVVEAKIKSGSLITAQHALEQGKNVYAIPGPVNELLSEGCHKLIFDGAGIAYSPEILLSEWGILEGFNKKDKEKENIFLASDIKLVYSCLDLRPRTFDSVVHETGFPPEKVSNFLLELELMGLIKETGRQYYVRK